DRFKQREIETAVYFHVDHFEPWRSIRGAPAVSPVVVDSLHHFLRTMERLQFARRLTLFYKPHLNYALREEPGLCRVDPGDLLGFLPRTNTEEDLCREGMRPFAGESEHEIQLHIHHEHYTATAVHSDPAAIDWFASPLGRSLDAQRLDLAIRLN